MSKYFFIFAALLLVFVPASGKAEDIVEDPVKEPHATAENIENEMLWGDLWGSIRTEWGQNFNPEKVIVHYKDVTCDGKKDYIASHINLDNPDGYFFNIVTVTVHDGESRTDSFSIPFEGATEQFGICMMDDNPSAEVEYDVWPPEEIEEFIGMDVCATSVGVVDGMCDTPQFFWSNESKPGEPRWVFFRH
ncbi:MAG: hypothetical protein DHS20C02_09010 [Micavibrio sp.]|nr:MAG: hypothetical protein DHS20C02_09010 [Micavibrio sp.]